MSIFKGELHYSGCIDENCEKVFCVERREYEAKIKKLEHVEAEFEIAARFGEWLKVDMSGCYDAADMVSLWKTEIKENYKKRKQES